MTTTFIITGGNTRLGLQCAAALGADCDNVEVLACRDVTAAESVARKLRHAAGQIEVMPLDLAKQTSVRGFVNNFCARVFLTLAGLFCNAGG